MQAKCNTQTRLDKNRLYDDIVQAKCNTQPRLDKDRLYDDIVQAKCNTQPRLDKDRLYDDIVQAKCNTQTRDKATCKFYVSYTPVDHELATLSLLYSVSSSDPRLKALPGLQRSH